jgi:CubicO group peptidase (beta-lactamase class C family)
MISGEKLTDELAAICKDRGTEAAIIWHGGKTLYEGPRVKQLFNAWSCTKSFTSLCFGLMVDEGIFKLDGLAHEWLPELKEAYPAVTFRHLLTFTSGIQTSEFDPFDLGEPLYLPGEYFRYSLESDWLSLAITRAANQSLSELFIERIGLKIGIDVGELDWKGHGVNEGLLINGGSGALEAGVHTTATTLLKFGQLMLQRGRWEGQQLISEAWLDEAQQSQAMGAVRPWDTEGVVAWYKDWLPGTYGLHWWSNGVMLDGRRLWPSAPAKTFAAQGNLNQICLVVPEWDLIIVRMGDDGVIEMQDYDRVLRLAGERFGAKLNEA